MKTIHEIIRKANEEKSFRSAFIERAAVNKETRTVSLSFSSEEPVERWFGYEILDHNPESVNLSRLKKGGSLLVDHDMTKLVGVIEDVSIDRSAKKGRADVRFGKRGLADDIFSDILDGIRTNVSVGYSIDEMVLERESKDGPSTYRVTRWTPFEISSVSIPADITVGVGRQKDVNINVNISTARTDRPECHSMDGEGDMMDPMKPDDCTMGEDCMNGRCGSAKKGPRATAPKENRTMDKCTVCGADMVGGKCPACEAKIAQQRDAAAVASVTATAHRMTTEQMEKDRIEGIRNLCTMNKLDQRYEQMWVTDGSDLNEVGKQILRILEERGKSNPTPASKIGLSARETQRFSLISAIHACASNDWTKAGFEAEASRAVAQRLNKMPDPRKFYIPFEVLQRPIIRTGPDGGQYRDLTVGTTTAGGVLVETENVGFIEMLRKRSVCMRMGARRLSGLQGNITIPKQTAGATAYWLTDEATQATEGGLVFTQISLSPKNVAAYVEISRQLMLQSSPGAEGLVSDDLAKQVALAADLAGLEGSGTEQPTGIANTGSIGSVTGATLGYDATYSVLDFQEDVAAADVVPIRGGYVTTPAVAKLLMKRLQFTGVASPAIWVGNMWDGTVAGFPGMSSNQLTAATMIFGDWQELVMAEWGVLEVEVNPYANFQAGIIGVRAMYSMDIGVRWPAAFSRATSIS